MPVPPKIKQKLIAGGMDDLLASHFARILVRDPLILCAEDISQPDLATSDLFEIFQGLTWQALRFKPPPPNNIHDIGWRVEFRSMEVQPTDFENAAFAIFIVFLTRAVLAFDVDFYMPISMVEENMETANTRDAVNTREFHFPAKWMTGNAHEVPARSPANESSGNSSIDSPLPVQKSFTNGNGPVPSSGSHNADPDCPILTPPPSPPCNPTAYPLTPLSTLINGPPSPTANPSAPGLLPLIKRYLDTLPTTVLTHSQRARLEPYLDLVARRADGTEATPATKIREIVRSSADYADDSCVGTEAEWRVVNEVGIGVNGTNVGSPDPVIAEA